MAHIISTEILSINAQPDLGTLQSQLSKDVIGDFSSAHLKHMTFSDAFNVCPSLLNVVCCLCGTEYNRKDGLGASGISHGICIDCLNCKGDSSRAPVAKSRAYGG